MEGFGPRRAAGRFRKRPRALYAAMVGTFFCFCLFVRHYGEASDDSVVWVWFGMRSDGRCGKEFGTDHVSATVCAKGQCCSSHGWCGVGEDYCSVALGCQSGCDPVSEDEQRRIDEQREHDPHQHHDDFEDDGGARFRHYRYDDDVHAHHGHHREAQHYDPGHHDYPGGHYGYDDAHHGGHHHYHDWHHRYDDDPHAHPDDYDAHLDHHDGRGGGDDVPDPGPELVGLHEKRHLGEGDGVPLEGE